MFININWIKVTLSQRELSEYLEKFPEYKENYYIIKR